MRCGFVEHRDVRLDPALMDQPGQLLGRAVGGVGGQPLGLEAEAVLRPLDHALALRHLGLADGGGRLDIDDDGVFEVDQVVGRVGEEGVARLGAPVQRAAGSAGEMNFGSTGVAAPNAASSSTARYSRTARLDRLGWQPLAAWHARCRLASA